MELTQSNIQLNFLKFKYVLHMQTCNCKTYTNSFILHSFESNAKCYNCNDKFVNCEDAFFSKLTTFAFNKFSKG